MCRTTSCWVPHSPEQRARESGPADPSAATHGLLTVIGMLPIIGIPANVADGIYSAAQGDKTGAGLSFAGAFPYFAEEFDRNEVPIIVRFVPPKP